MSFSSSLRDRLQGLTGNGIMSGPILRSRISPRHLLYSFLAVSATWLLYTTLYSREHSVYDLDTTAPGSRPTIKPAPYEPPPPKPSPTTWPGKAEAVKDAFLHAYHGYEHYAMPADELLPNSERKTDNFNSWGVTIFDSLDTMILMDLQPELERAMPIVRRANFEMIDFKAQAPFFETVIRYLGGLLSAYALTNDTVFLTKAQLLGSGLEPAFRTKSGFPVFSISTTTGQGDGNEIGGLAEVASCQVEYAYLAKASGKKEYFKLADRIVKNLEKANLTTSGGMLTNWFNISSGETHGTVLSVGAAGDSAHEYLLKYYLLTGRKDKKMLEMYLRFTTQVIAELLFVSPVRHMLYVTDTKFYPSRTPSHIFEHLSTFVAGLFALGAHLLPLDDLASVGIDFATLGLNEDHPNSPFPPRTQEAYEELAHHNLSDVHRWVAEGIAHSAWLTYADMSTGLGADELHMNKLAQDASFVRPDIRAEHWLDELKKWREGGKVGKPPGLHEPEPRVYGENDRSKGPTMDSTRDYSIKKDEYLLRPETLESFFLMWKTTGDVKWRERGWTVFEAIERETKTRAGYSSIRYVDHAPGYKKDDMPSFFLAETLKYLYLMFIDEDKLPLDKWVFNTEAHPLPVFDWTESEKKAFGVSYS